MVALLVTGFGTVPSQADMPARPWKNYAANPDEIKPMQKICLQWSSSNAPAGTELCVVASKYRAAAFAKSMLKSQRAGSQ
jgi:hypothetical protein